MTNKNLIIANFVTVCYFVFLWGYNITKINHVFIGVFKEILTLPFLVIQTVLLLIGIKNILKNQRNLLFILSVILLGICFIITTGSIFF